MKNLQKFSLTPLMTIVASGMLLTACSTVNTSEETQQTVKESTQQINNKVMAFARYVPERRDDFAWENDKVAFRVYGPAAPEAGHSSGVDAWLKRVDYSIIDKWYKGHTQGISYHEDKGEGYDPYHTGISRGVGGSAIWIEGKAYAAHNWETFDIHQNGKDVTSFTLAYKWDTPLGKVEEAKTITLALGDQLYSVDSTFKLNGKPAKLPIAIGLATHDEKAKVNFNKQTGRISAWEIIDGIGIGTGAIINPSDVENIRHIPSDVKDESHIWMFTSTDANGKLTYKAGFAWQGAGEITSNSQWQNYLDQK